MMELLAGAALGLSVAVPFGPVSLMCVQQSLNHGHRHGMVSGFAAATSQGIFATAALIGAGTVSVVLMPWSNTIRLLSAVVLVWLGVRTILRARTSPKPILRGGLRAAYASALVVALTNPLTVVPYLALATVAAEENTGGPALSLWSVPGVMVGAATWYSALTGITSIMRSGISPGVARTLNRVAGSAMIVFGLLVGHGLLAP